MARFHAGAWDDLMEGFRTMQEVMGERSDEPPPFATIAYGPAALVHELRGEDAAADRLLEVLDRLQPGQDVGLPYADAYTAKVFAHRGNWDGAFRRLARQKRDRNTWPLLLEVECDLIADAGRWDDAKRVVTASRERAERAGVEALFLFADRLEGRAALAGGDPAGAVEPLRRAAQGFERFEGEWERAVCELYLAEALVAAGSDPSAELAGASATFDRLGAVREARLARDLASRA
jgi:hypothetical protein